MAESSAYELWRQAGGDTPSFSRERYRELLLEHGLLIPLAPGERREPLPCGWPDRRISEPCGCTPTQECDRHYLDDDDQFRRAVDR